ncbi:MAG TPA: hypothetical protein VN822_10010 [Candidatus Acidoferrales bacterium]|nr:hypothetical protein [Candidatus Acidoferrales bacterium]
MKINSLKIPPKRPYATPVKPGATPASPIATQVKSPAHTAPAKLAIANRERKLGQRVLLRVRASIQVVLQGKPTILDAATLSVTPQGALVVTNRSLPADTHLVLEHGGTKQRVDCKVARPPRETAEGFHTPLEFDAPAPGFWKIDFPPTDWRPDDV